MEAKLIVILTARLMMRGGALNPGSPNKNKSGEPRNLMDGTLDYVGSFRPASKKGAPKESD